MVFDFLFKKKSREQMDLETGITKDYNKLLREKGESRRRLESAERERKRLEKEEFFSTSLGRTVRTGEKYAKFELGELGAGFSRFANMQTRSNKKRKNSGGIF